ncbi:peptidoglycan DD-metalloendopeptidase family protein [Rhodanobacter sp. B2A1Ga4]|uniref:peptidoglycan DD-metalloendopeptidase family protein n=1 Tax=Rhodanobacter sp. B2A1Ga4 TaxID=2778647 RepID=UPI001B364948|nr:peptidoglycan DD-metalloendopeptidase family protein [Rhodanobacter sp. B2A1Ga4]MBQ4853882.1 peptidoglycan DD-metalloendopeptidase family protein [Rhodanobacter sp. B2A1Ga4]
MLVRMDRYLQWLATLAVTVLLAACGTMRSSVVVEPAAGGYDDHRPVTATTAPARTPIPGGSYAVVQGDTLYSIAFRKGVDFRDLAQWNGIAAPYTIWPGQRLTLSPPAKTAAGPVTATPGHVGGASVASAPASAPAASSAPVFEPVAAPATLPPAHPSAAASASVPATSPTSVPLPAKSAAPAVAATMTAVVPVAGMPAAVPATMPAPSPPPAGVSRVVSSVQWRWPADGSLVGRFQGGDAIPGIEIAGKSGDPVRAAADGVVVYSGNGLVGYGELVIIKHNDSFLSAYGHNRKRLVKEGQRVSMGQQIAEMGSTGATRNELEFQIRKDGNPVDPLGYLPPR